MVAVFLKGYRIRLKLFRPKYRNLFLFLFSTLIFFDIVLLTSPYIFSNKIFSQFRYSKQIATYLKQNNINNLKCKDKVLCEKLYFYGLKRGNQYLLEFDKNTKKVSISHNGKKIYNFYVSKLNKK